VADDPAAASALAAGEVALVHPGVCPEGVETRAASVRFVAAEPGTTVVQPPAGIAGFNVQHDGVLVDGYVVRSSHQGVLAAKSKAAVPAPPVATPLPTSTPSPSPKPTTAKKTPTPVPSPAGSPQPGSGATYWVDPVSGDDARSTAQAGSAATPWRRLGRALNAARPGDVVVLRPGVYSEQADLNADAVTLRGDGPLGEVVIAPPPGRVGVYVNGFANARVEDLVVRRAAQGIVGRSAPGLRVNRVAVVESGSNGIVLEDCADVWVDELGSEVEVCLAASFRME
jgi:hypothetical protein